MKIALAMAALATLLSAAVMVPRMPAEPRSEPRCPYRLRTDLGPVYARHSDDHCA